MGESFRLAANEDPSDMPSSRLIEEREIAGKRVCETVKSALDPSGPHADGFKNLHALFTSVMRHEMRHFAETHEDDWTSRQPTSSSGNEELVRDRQGKLIAYKCALNNGGMVTAELNPDRSIEKISVNDEPDALWLKAYKQYSLSIPYFGCGPVLFMPAKDSPIKKP